MTNLKLSDYKVTIYFLFFFILNSCGMNRLVVEGAKTIIQDKSHIENEKLDDSVKLMGIYKIGQPYQINGITYIPKIDNDYSKVGIASWYGPNFHNRLTANGEVFDQELVSAAHKTLPLPSIVSVKNLENEKFMFIRVNDRGPFVGDRIIDLSKKAAEKLGFLNSGTARVEVKLIETGPHLLEEKYRLSLDNLYRMDDLLIIENSKVKNINKSMNGIYIQLGAFAEKNNAKNMIAELNEIDLDKINNFNYIINSEEKLFKVLIGPLSNMTIAKNIANELNGLGYSVHVIKKKG